MTKQHLRVFRDLLSSADMDVRMEAGENLALLHESRIILGLTGGGEATERFGGGGGGGDGGGSSGVGGSGEDEEDGGEEEGDQDDDDGAAEMEAMDLTVLWEEVVEEMKGFITDSSKKVWCGYAMGPAARATGGGGWGVLRLVGCRSAWCFACCLCYAVGGALCVLRLFVVCRVICLIDRCSFSYSIG